MLRLDIAHLERLGYLSGLPMRLSWSSGNGQVGCLVVLALASGLKLMYRTRTGGTIGGMSWSCCRSPGTPMRLGGARGGSSAPAADEDAACFLQDGGSVVGMPSRALQLSI